VATAHHHCLATHPDISSHWCCVTPALCAVGTDEKGSEVEEWDYLNRFFRRFNK
jgi:hypothetical protein